MYSTVSPVSPGGSTPFGRTVVVRTSNMSTLSAVSGNLHWTSEISRSQFQDQLRQMATAVGIPLTLPRSLLSLPTQRAATLHPSDKAGAEEFLMSLRPKRVMLGRSSKNFSRDETMIALDKAVWMGQSELIVEALIQLAASYGVSAGSFTISSTTDKRGHSIPTMDSIFTRAEDTSSFAVWRLFLGKVSERALTTSLSKALEDRSANGERIKSLLEYGANPELCQERILDLLAIGSEQPLDMIFLSPRLTDIELLSCGLIRAASSTSTSNVCMVLLRGADANFNQAEALKAAISAMNYESTLAIVTMTKTPITSTNLDDAAALIGSWNQSMQKPFLKILLCAGGSGPRISKALVPFIKDQDHDIICKLIEYPAARHSTFPAPNLFQTAIDVKDLGLAQEVLRSSANRSFSDYANTGVHRQLVKNYSDNPEQTLRLISDLLTLGSIGDYSSEMLIDCCATEQIRCPSIMPLINLLIHSGAKADYMNGAALHLAIKAANTDVVDALMVTKPTKKILNIAISYASTCLQDGDPAKLEIWSKLLPDVSGPTVDHELITAIDKSPHAIPKVKVLLKSASLDFSDGQAVVKAVQIQRLDLLETMLSRNSLQRSTITSIWKQIRELFALTVSEDGRLPYNASYMQKVCELLHNCSRNATPLHDLLHDATQCASKEAAFNMSKLFLQWGATPNHALGGPIRACIKRCDARTLALLLTFETSKTSLKYGCVEALQAHRTSRHIILDMLISAGLEGASLDAALSKVLAEDLYDKPTAHLLIESGATIRSAFGKSLKLPAVNLDLQVIEKLLPGVIDKESVLLPLNTVLTSHSDWRYPDGVSLPMVKILLKSCDRGTWADRLFMTEVKACNGYAANIFAEHVTCKSVYSDTLQELLTDDTMNFDRDKLLVTQYLLDRGAQGSVVDNIFLRAAELVKLDWIVAMSPHLSDLAVLASAFELLVDDRKDNAQLQGNKLKIVQLLLKQGVRGPNVDNAFMRLASVANLKAITELHEFVSLENTFSESLDLLTQRVDLLVSSDGLAAAKFLIAKGVLDISVASAAKVVAKAGSVLGVKTIVGVSSTKATIHAAFQGFIEQPEPLESPANRAILMYLLESGLQEDDAIQVACLAAVTYDVDVIRILASSENSRELCEKTADSVGLTGDAWLSPKGVGFVKYLLTKNISIPAIHKLVEIAAEAFHLPALRMLILACHDNGQAVELAFSCIISKNERWTSPGGTQVVSFLLQQGAKGPSVERAAAYAAKTSNYDALDLFLRSSAAAIAIPAAFKALTRGIPGQMSSDQLTIASILVKQGVSTQILAIAAIEMAKLLDLEGLKVLARSSHFCNVADDVFRALLLSEDLWRAPEGLRLMRFLLQQGASTKITEVASSKAAAALDIDALCTIVQLNSHSSVIDSAFTSMLGLEKSWLCPEGFRVAEFLLQRAPSLEIINKAFIQASQYVHLDIVKLLHIHIDDISVFSEALYKATSTDSKWLSELSLIELLLNSGAGGEAVEFALIAGAKSLHFESLVLLSSKIDRPEVYSKALGAALAHNHNWRSSLMVIEFLLQHGAEGEPVERAYVLAAKALDLEVLRFLDPYVDTEKAHSSAFCVAASSESLLWTEHIELLTFLYNDTIDSHSVENALVLATKALSIAAVNLLCQNANESMCTKAFSAFAPDTSILNSVEGSEIVHILAKKGARGEAVDEAFIKSSRLGRLDLVSVLSENIYKENIDCISRAFSALVSSDGANQSYSNIIRLSDPDGLAILQILVNKGANGESIHDTLVNTARSGNTRAVEILTQVVRDSHTYSMAFDALTASGTMWLHSDYLALISTLLSNGASGESVHFALANALTYVIEGGASTELLELLLKYHADINFDNGKSLQLATYHGRQDLFKLLLLHGDPNPLSIYMSLQAALSNNLEEETVFQLFKSVTANKSMQTEPDVNNSSDLGLPLIFYCLENYPKSARLAKEICSLHADLSLTVTQKFHLDECNNPLFEQIPPLLFALERNCSDEVIQVLIDHCGNIDFMTENSRATALMLAAGKGRSLIVAALIDRGASVFQKSASDKTPLCYAARSGDISSMTSILKKNPPRNDGALHEAARELHADAIKLLIKANHEIHFPSSRHEGRSPLCELCYACKVSHETMGLQATITELSSAKAEPLRKSRGRTALFMAMENRNPVPVVTALIEACLWKDLNDPQNIYEQGDYFYSPTMYIKKGIINQHEAISKALLEKLQDFGASDRYYAKERMQQPLDATGMPQRILDFDHKKWIRSSRREEEDEDHARKLRRQEEEMENRRILSQRQHLLVLEQRETLGKQQSSHTLDKHLLSMKLRDREHALEITHQEETCDHHLGEIASSNQVKMNIEASRHATQFGIQKQSWEAQLQHESQRQEQKIGYLGKELGARYFGLEAQQIEQNLRLEGMSSEIKLRQLQQLDELNFQQSRSGIENADLDHKLQHANQLNLGRVQMNRDLGEIAFTTRQSNNLLEIENRQSQEQHQWVTDQQRLSTQNALSQQEYARNQDFLNTRRAQGQIDMSTRAGISRIDRDTMRDTLQMTQQDRDHQLQTEHAMGLIQNQNLQEKFALHQQDRGHQLETEHRIGQIQNRSLQGRLGLQFNHLKATNNERLGFQQAKNQEQLNFQQALDQQQLQTLGATGRLENDNLQMQNHSRLDYLQKSGLIQLNQDLQSKTVDLDYQQQRLRQKAQGRTIDLNYEQRSGIMALQQQAIQNGMEMEKNDFMHSNQMADNVAQEYLMKQRARSEIVIRQAQIEGSRVKQQDNTGKCVELG